MVNENGKKWHELRKLLTPPLANRITLANYAVQMNLIADDFARLIARQRDDKSHIVTN